MSYGYGKYHKLDHGHRLLRVYLLSIHDYRAMKFDAIWALVESMPIPSSSSSSWCVLIYGLYNKRRTRNYKVDTIWNIHTKRWPSTRCRNGDFLLSRFLSVISYWLHSNCCFFLHTFLKEVVVLRGHSVICSLISTFETVNRRCEIWGYVWQNWRRQQVLTVIIIIIIISTHFYNWKQ